ncbi:uncharacterized protein LOC126897286 [Daktulosphaira vitifoliae]|uniref:uncharacterized protein LOC126897286 n=1 Tax=Daktulosphaira vitifoliae TaxID=58002 RepID=UPI0021AAB71F|nr:uncharacterized protein LOC126897286 [Daktulosphaira vitifoliae]
MAVRTLNKNDCSCEQTNLHLHAEIENLKQKILERENHILSMETNFLCEAEKFPHGEYAALTDEVLMWQDKYRRLLESHKRIQRVNQSLEDKLLLLVDKTETEKNVLNSEIQGLSRKIVDQQLQINQLNDENERYKNDLNIAIQLLQCKPPSHFVSQKYDNLPGEMQSKVRSYIYNKQRRLSDGNGNMSPKSEGKTIKVPITTFPPTAMVYSLNNDTKVKDVEDGPTQPPVNSVSAAIIAKVLEERIKERLTQRHCSSCSCETKNETEHFNNALPCSEFSEKRRSYVRHSKRYSNKSSESPISEPDLIHFDNTMSIGDSSESGSKLHVARSRLCSVRLQEGSNNILLDNAATPYSGPILYKSRSSSGEFDEPLVHSQKSIDRNSHINEHTRILISDEEII